MGELSGVSTHPFSRFIGFDRNFPAYTTASLVGLGKVNPKAGQNQRRYDIDWLRVTAMLAVFFFHNARFFDFLGWHLKNAEKSIIVSLFIVLLALWTMPLFFLLSGVGSWYALESRTSGQYLLDRVKRLLIPLYTVGAFVLLPPQLYWESVTQRAWTASFWTSYPLYFTRTMNLSPSPLFGSFWPGHLWFLKYLFLVSVFTLPLLLYLKSEPGQRLIIRLAEWCDCRGGIFQFLIPLALVRVGLRHLFGGEHTWADLFEYSVFFVIGYLIPADKRFTEGFKRHGWVCLTLGIAGFGGTVFMALRLGYMPLFGESFSGIYVLFQIVWSIASWSWVVFVFGLGAKHLNFNNRALAYANEAVLPFYILHQTMILLVGWYVIPTEMSIPLKYMIISTSSFVLIMALYELLIKRIRAVRLVFGMRR
jgi:glucan biosynthesis protein C